MSSQDAPLRLALASSFLNESSLRSLADDSLKFYPLGKIFVPSSFYPNFEHFGWGNIFDQVRDFYRKGVFDLFALIVPGREGEFVPSENVVISSNDPVTLAHEIGHFLGLKHPSSHCWGRRDESFCNCEYEGNIMGYCRGKRDFFSSSDSDLMLGGRK